MPARQTAAPETESDSYKVGYRNPPRHTQFRKGRSGNPGGRPRRTEAERLKAITLQEAYRLVAIRENGIMQPVVAMEAVMRRQVELAMEGNVHAQRDLLRAVRTYEREDTKAATIDAYVGELVRQAANLEEGIAAAKRAAQTPAQKMSFYEAAQRMRQLLGLPPYGPAETTEEPGEQEPEEAGEEAETDAEETDADSDVAAPPPVDRAPQPENDAARAVPPSASPPAAQPPADPPPHRPRRHASRRTPEPRPSDGADAGARPHGTTRGVIPRESGGSSTPWRREARDPSFRGDDGGEAHAPARPAAKSAKVPDKVPVLRDSGRRSKRAARRHRGRSG
jgi:hypothetical protein